MPEEETPLLETDSCSICLEGIDVGMLETSLCACKGSCGQTHASCLDKWRKQFPLGDDRRDTCMQCAQAYGRQVDEAASTWPDVRERSRNSCVFC
jgi:hypothetical protein